MINHLPVTNNTVALHEVQLVDSSLAASDGLGKSDKKKYLVGLDALRAIAALSVCFFHYSGGMLPKLIVPSIKQTFSKGYLGVEIFFVISGFIIPYSLVGKNHQISGFFTYLKKRVLRINPPAYVSLLLVLCQWLLIDTIINHDTHYTENLTWGQVISNLLFIVPFTKYGWINGIFWTLAIEFQFYLFIGILFNALFNKPVAWFVFIYLLIAAFSFVPYTESVSFLRYSSLFAVGGVALLWHQQRITLWGYIAGLVLFGGITVWQLDVYAAVVGVGTAVAINAVNFRIPFISSLGKISYSLYLMHGLVGTTAEFILIKLLPPTTDARKMLLTAICVVLAIAGSYIFHLLVEKPFMRLGGQKQR